MKEAGSCGDPRRPTGIWIGAIANMRPISLTTAACAMDGKALLSSLPSSHRPVSLCDTGPSDTSSEQDGESNGLIACFNRPVVGFKSGCAGVVGVEGVCDRVLLAGPSRSSSLDRLAKSLCFSAGGHSLQSRRRFRRPLRACGSQRQGKSLLFTAPPDRPPSPPPPQPRSPLLQPPMRSITLLPPRPPLPPPRPPSPVWLDVLPLRFF